MRLNEKRADELSAGDWRYLRSHPRLAEEIGLFDGVSCESEGCDSGSCGSEDLFVIEEAK